MLLDRQEKHVLKALKSQYRVPTDKLLNRLIAKEYGIYYKYYLPSITECIITNSSVGPLNYWLGSTILSERDKEVVRARIGRMIAFGRAILYWYNDAYNNNFQLSGSQLEDLARGNYKYEMEVITSNV